MSMSNTAKNLMIVLVAVTVMFAGYYFLVQESSLVLRSSESERQLEQMLIRTQEFVGHRQILDSITLDASILQTNEFRNLQSFSPEPSEFPAGRTNPFTVTGPEQRFVDTQEDASESSTVDQQ